MICLYVLRINTFESSALARASSPGPLISSRLYENPLPVNPFLSDTYKRPSRNSHRLILIQMPRGYGVPKSESQAKPKAIRPYLFPNHIVAAASQANLNGIRSLHKKDRAGVELQFRFIPIFLCASVAIRPSLSSDQIVGCASPSPCGRINSRTT
jgi:hypothetical protein